MVAWLQSLTILLTFAGLGLALYQIDMSAIANIDWRYFSLAILLAIFGFVIQGATWWWSVKQQSFEYLLIDGIREHGVTIFAKYIPGKVLMIMGRAALTHQTTHLSVKQLGLLSLSNQIITLLASVPILLIAFIVTPTFLADEVFKNHLSWPLLIILFVGFCIFIYALLQLRSRKRNWFDAIFSVGNLGVFVLASASWVFFSLGFSLLLMALGMPFSFGHGSVFVIAAVIGIVAIIFPGGLGIREAGISGMLIASGVATETAIQAAILSRLWFLIGELVIFLLSTPRLKHSKARSSN